MPARCALAFALCLVLAVAARPAAAQTLLRWKLAPGQTYTVQLSQQTQSQVGYSGKSATTAIDVEMRLLWHVTAADADQIELTQKIDRLSVKLATPAGGAVQFDSSAPTRAAGPARQLVDSLQPLVGAEVAITLSPRGELVAARPLNDAARRIIAGSATEPAGGKGGEQQPADQGGVSPGALAQLLRQSFLVFPEREVSPGDTWNSEAELATAAGPMLQTTTYKLAEITERGDEKLARIEVGSKLAPKPGSGTPPPSRGRISIQSQEHRGTVLFSIDRGCVSEAEQSQKLVTQRPYRDITITVTLSSTEKTTVRNSGP